MPTMTKQGAMNVFLAKGETRILCDARQPGVNVPAGFEGSNALALNFSYKYENVSLIVNAWGIRANLSFNRKIFPVAVPWEAVYIISQAKVPGAYLEWPTPGEPPAAVEGKKKGGLRLV